MSDGINISEFVDSAARDLHEEFMEHHDQRRLSKDSREMAVDIANEDFEARGVAIDFRFTQSDSYIAFVREVENKLRSRLGLPKY